MVIARETGPAVRRAHEHERELRRLVEAANAGKLPEDLAREVLAADKRRKVIHRVDKAGNIVRASSFVEWRIDVDHAREVQLGVVDGAVQQTVCAGWKGKCPDGAKPPKGAFRPALVKRRGGEPWRCRHCGILKANMSITAEQRSAAARKRVAAQTPEQRSDIARKRQATIDPRIRREVARLAGKASVAANACRTREQRRESAAKRAASLTPQQRSEISRKAWATRRAKKGSKS